MMHAAATLTEESTQSPMKGVLKGQTGLIMGVAHQTSIAWAIAKALDAAGMRLAFTYQGERLEKNVRELTATLENAIVLPCDVTKDEDLEALFRDLDSECPNGLNTVVHSVAFANKEDLAGDFVNTSRDGYLLAQNISAYSLTAVTRYALPLLERAGGGSVITLSYLGGERVVKNYNVMGVAKAALEMSVRYLAANLGEKNIRVNAISAGPIKTLAARGISGFSHITDHMKNAAPLRRNVTADEVGNTALFLASPLASGITGEVLHVDAGFHCVAYDG